MEVHWGKATVGFWSVVVFSIGLPLAYSAPVDGQTVTDPAKVRMQEMDRRELQLNSAAADNWYSNDPKRRQAMVVQVGEDFRRILTLHNEIVRAINTNRFLTPQFISDATGEIRKRSTRLQSSLRLQRSEPVAHNRASGPGLKIIEMKDELILLCRQIESFVRNPIIETPGTIDAQRLEEARRDLESVVELSSNLKKRADKQKN